jgi:predicted enzyme related to lactoylglutathione lyase
MAKRTKYAPGTFSWTDLTTTDQEGAKRFYSELFGWTAVDTPMGEGMVYSMMQLGGNDAAAISPQMQAQRDAGAPPTWNSYVTVESADATVDRAKGLGANIMSPAFDVFDAGRMAIIQDPQGALFMPWEPKQHIGASVVNAHGALSWNELASPDMDASANFYRELFGWEITPMEGMAMPYQTIKTAAGNNNGGIRPAQENEPCYWLVYFGAGDIDATDAQAQKLGGTSLMSPMDIGVGKIGVVHDPQGAVFGLYAGDFED